MTKASNRLALHRDGWSSIAAGRRVGLDAAAGSGALAGARGPACSGGAGPRPRSSSRSSVFPGLPRLRGLYLTLLTGLTLLGGLLSFGASAAHAELPWWHLSSGPRPAYLHVVPHTPVVVGAPKVQEILVTNEAGTSALELDVGCNAEGHACADELGFFVYPEATANEDSLPTMNAANLQSALETVYGVGKVTVTEHIEGEKLSFKVSTPHGTLPVTPLPAGIGSVETKEVSLGTADTPEGTDGELYVTAENLGDANAEGSKEPIVMRDVIPHGLKALRVMATEPEKEDDYLSRVAISCALEEKEGQQIATCSTPKKLVSYDQLEMRIAVNVEPGAHTGEVNEATVSGGGGREASIKRPITISAEEVPFGVETYEMAAEEEGGAPVQQAGVHPFQFTQTIDFNQLKDLHPIENLKAGAGSTKVGAEGGQTKPEVTTPASTKDVKVALPPGLIGNPSEIPQCTITQFFEVNKEHENANLCPAASAVGVATVTIQEPADAQTINVTVPIFNIEPHQGEPARFGFYVIGFANAPVFIDASVRTGSDYGVTASVDNVTQSAAFLSSETTFWGVPGDPRHNDQRGWACTLQERGKFGEGLCSPSEEAHPVPFLVMPTRCDVLSTSLEYDSWQNPGVFGKVEPPQARFLPEEALGGCDRLQFAPGVKVAPDGEQASKPTGLTVDVHVPQEVNDNGQGLASSNVRKIEVAFPRGVVLNPSAADGLQACAEGLAGFDGGARGAFGEFLFTPALPEPVQQGVNFCPDSSKIGTVTIKSPLLPKGQFVNGSLYLATPAPNGEPGNNPFNSLIAMYIVVQDPISGTLVKLPGSVSLDQSTGQIVSTFDNNPELAFEDAEIHLFGGERAPLATPAHCGTYTTQATFTPWSGNPPVTTSSQFNVTSGPNGSACPGASLPFAPTFTGGMPNVNAGAFSDLTTTFGREDGNQDINRVQLHFPPGLSGILTGIPLCGEAQANAGTCSDQSLIGETIVSVGLGGDPFSVTGGKVYLTGAYHGAPFGLSIVNPAVAGPFNLGKVIVRAKIEVDPRTAALTVTTNSENEGFAIPHILDGIPLQIKHINVTITRPGFTFNPTNCGPQAITGSLGSDEGATASFSERFQVTNCANLKFTPKFTVTTAGKNSKAGGATLTAKLAEPNEPQGSQANIARVKVDLPKQLPSRLTTLQKACTDKQFEANPAGCPKESKIGYAVVHTPLLPVPLEGPAIFVSHGGEAFPSLTMVLQGYGVTVDLVGTTFISKAGITSTTFKTVPDVPFNTFSLTLPQGKFSALAANVPNKDHYSLCGQSLAMPTEFLAQNGAKINESTKIAVTGCGKVLTRSQKLTAALKACHKKHDKGKREACERTAKKKYGSKPKTKHR